jgi:hypothetical protein
VSLGEWFPPFWRNVLSASSGSISPRIILLEMTDPFNPFQSNFSATRILPSSYLFWAGKRLVDYLSVLHEEKRRTGSDSGAGEQTQQKNVLDVFRHWSGTGKS